MTAPAPFSCTYTPNIPELLIQLGCSIALSTYQAGKVVMLSPKNVNQLVQLPRTFNKAMGIAVKGQKMAIATKDELIVLVNSPQLAPTYPKNPNTYDALFVPRATYYTGHVDIHDIHFGQNEIWAVNTSFSCLCTIDDSYSFTPKWRPKFITNLASEDRCHLNGLAMKDDQPAYISALGNGDTPQSWRSNITKGGIIIDLKSNEIIANELPMPHSPRIYNNELYVLFSASGELAKIDVQTGKYDVIFKKDAFLRGMTKCGDYLFIAQSKLRQNSSTFKDLPIAHHASTAGISIVHLPTGSLTGEITYKSSVDEIYDIQVLNDIMRPGILNPYTEVHKTALSIPGQTFWSRSEK